MFTGRSYVGSNSSIPGFYKKSRDDRIRTIKEFAGLDDGEADLLRRDAIPFEILDNMIENAAGVFPMPLGVATNFTINGVDYLIPMVIEEPSVVAAASRGAKDARVLGGFTAGADPSISTGEIQILGVEPADAESRIRAAKGRILDAANSESRTLSRMGKGAVGIECRTIPTDSETMLVVDLLVDVADAMGANVTNTMCEAVSPIIEEITGGRALLRILSNYSTRRLARASARFAKESVGKDTVRKMILAYQLAKHDPYRAVTHNKGILNGVIAAANATGQDCRAIEAAAHAYAARDGRYTSLTEWREDQDGNLEGSLEIPLPVGIVGGITDAHPTARLCAKILGVSSARELAGVLASVGLAQNYSAMRALCTDGIQSGHMKLHSRKGEGRHP